MNSPAAGPDTSCPCEFTENLEILRQIDFFSGFPIEKLKVMAYLCTREAYGPGDLLFVQNEDDGQAFYVISGEVVLSHEANGRADTIGRFGAGELLGGLALLGSMRRLFSLRAASDTTCLVLTREKFVKALEQFPDLVPRLLKVVVGRIRNWEKRRLFAIIERGEDPAGKAGVSVL